MEPVAHPPASSRSKYVAMAVLIMANMLNYMDRFTVAGVLPDLEEYFKMDNKQSGLLQVGLSFSFTISVGT
uniref:MFS domain-containing protein n=1 Tax=Steinernema glaseri TaxID=37863 RepID=A0A1I7YUU1_9BILA